MSTPRDRRVRVLVLHGLLGNETQEDQLQLLLAGIRGIPGIAEVVAVSWYPEAAGVLPFRRIQDGRLGRRFWDFVREQIEGTRPVPRPRDWIVVAYSGGGWLFYDWAVKAPDAAKALVKKSIIIAAPLRIIPDLGTNRRNVQFEGAERSIAAWDDLNEGAILGELGGLIHVVYSQDDGLVAPENATFSATSVATGRVSHRRFDGLSHAQMVTDPLVVAHIVAEVASAVA